MSDYDLQEGNATAWAGAIWSFDVFALPLSDNEKITLLMAMEHRVRPEGELDWQNVYPTTQWLAGRRGLSEHTIRKHTRRIRKALGGLW